MKSKIIFLFLLLSNLLSAQDSEWGIGVLTFSYDGKKEINVYDAPNGKVDGSLGMENDIHSSGNRTITWRHLMGPRMHIPDEALISIGYEIQGLIVQEEKDGYLKIMYTEGDIISWVSLKELEHEDFAYLPWIKFMSDSGRTFFTFNYGMNVREEPNAKAARVLMVKGEHFEIEPTGEINGLWAEVIIKEYDTDYCEEPHNLVKTYYGWMKILDDKGFPNVWFYAKGC